MLFFSLATTLVVGILLALTFTGVCVGLAMLVLLPVLMGTTCLAVSVWFWGWAGWYVLGRMGMLEHKGERWSVKWKNENPKVDPKKDVKM